MRSSTKSESNGNNSDNMNNNTLDVDEEKRTADDAIDVANECSSKLLNQAGNSESELTQRAEPAVETDQSAKVNVYEQVRATNFSSNFDLTNLFRRLPDGKRQSPWREKLAFNESSPSSLQLSCSAGRRSSSQFSSRPSST